MTSSHPAETQEAVKYRPDIDGLRAIAVLSVVAYHGFPAVVHGGFIGVDIFFVISGFLISTIILQGLNQHRFSFAEFYARRVLRIFPALIVVLSACLIVGWFTLVAYKYQQLGQEIEAGTTFLANILFWRLSSYFDVAAEGKPLLHLWSLGVEEQFYIVWPVTLYVCHRLRWWLVPLAIVAIGLVSYRLNILAVRVDPSDAFYLPHTRFWELLIGAALAYAKLSPLESIRQALDELALGLTRRWISFSDLWSLAGVGLIIYALHHIHPDDSFPGKLAVLPTVGAFLLIAGGPVSWVNRYLLSNRLMVFVGLISYPLYLWHWPALYFLRAMIFVPSGYDIAGAIALSILLAWLTYHFIELPLRRSKIRWGSLRLAASATAAVMALVLAAGVTADLTHGLPQRDVGNIATILQYRKYNYWIDYRNDYCLLFGKEQTFSPVCVETDKMAAGDPVLALWGDSHAAHLYRGIVDNPASAKLAIAQFTSSSCPPIFDFDKNGRPLCRPINDTVRSKFLEIKPKIVVLAHDWLQSTDQDAIGKLGPTVDILRKMGVERIILVGQVPHWNGSLPEDLSAYVDQYHPATLPMRMKLGLATESFDLDSKMAQRAKELGIEYISPVQTLCNDDGCLTMVPDAPDIPISWDPAHFTREGSRYFINQVADKLFGGPRQNAASPNDAVTR
jgi:peptidoglycan/LPS O-acetylase OafA/YrhL